MTADEPVAGVPRLCARADCARPRGHDDECGPDRADTEMADLRAEVERLTQDIDECWVPLYHGEVHERRQAEARAEKAEAERDAALARLAEAEGVARTNAAWVQQQHAAAKEAREQRDALQRQVLEAEVKLSQSVPAFYGWATYDDGSRSDLEWWVKASDDDWVSLNSERRTTGDIMVEHFSCWPIDGPPHAAGVRP